MKAKELRGCPYGNIPRSSLDRNQCTGQPHGKFTMAADYKVTRSLENGKEFIPSRMCPEAMVNASSEQQMLAVNGMSYHSRAGQNANSAWRLSPCIEDSGSDAILAGMSFREVGAGRLCRGRKDSGAAFR